MPKTTHLKPEHTQNVHIQACKVRLGIPCPNDYINQSYNLNWTFYRRNDNCPILHRAESNSACRYIRLPRAGQFIKKVALIEESLRMHPIKVCVTGSRA